MGLGGLMGFKKHGYECARAWICKKHGYDCRGVNT